MPISSVQEVPSTRQPLLGAALAFAAGVWLQVHFWRPPFWWVPAFALLATGAIWFAFAATRSAPGPGVPGATAWRRILARILALAAMASVGAFSVAAHDSRVKLPDIATLANGSEVEVTAHVTHDSVLRGGGSAQRQSVDLETEEIASGATRAPVAAGLRLTIYNRSRRGEELEENSAAGEAQPAPVLIYGERLRFPVKLRVPRDFGNPGAWDYRGYLAGQGIVALGTVAADRIEILPGTGGTGLGRWGSRLRRSVLGRIRALWPGEEANLLDAVLIGERSGVTRETSAGWQRTGIYHILVVSGMNVGILAFVVFGAMRRLRAGDLVATILTITVAAGYAWLAELGAPVLRSVLMLAVYLAARLLYRDRAPLNAVGCAALVLLVVQPRALFDPSYQLTFVAVVAIAGIAVPVLERTSGPYRRSLRYLDSLAYDLSLPAKATQLRIELRMISARLAPLIPLPGAWQRRAAQKLVAGTTALLLSAYELVAMSAIMQIALALPMASYFHRATVVGLPANVLAVPLTGALMPAAAMALGFSYVWLPLAKAPALVAGWALEAILWTVTVLGSLRTADVRLATPTLVKSLAAMAGFALAMLLIRRRRSWAVSGIAALLAAAVWLAMPPRPQVRPGLLEITALDVGEAESLLVISPEGRTLLVDAAGTLGPWQSEFDFGEDVVSPYLWSRGITRLDAVAVTHPHADHAGGMAAIIANFRPRELWLAPMEQTPLMERVLASAARYDVTIVPRAAHDQFRFGGVDIRVLAPRAGAPVSPRHKNDDSLVMKLTFGSTSALLEGDAEKPVERYLVEESPQADLLKVAHHGSRTSTTPELLGAVSPRFAVISSGAGNHFGHPRPEVLERLARARVATYRTDALGAISFYLDGNRVQARPAVPR